jgi:hypothetical protein
VRETSLKRTHCSFLSQLQMKPAACAWDKQVRTSLYVHNIPGNAL